MRQINFSLVTDLFYDLRDGTRLLALLSVLTGRTYVSSTVRETFLLYFIYSV